MMRLRLTRPPLPGSRYARKVSLRLPLSKLTLSDPIISPTIREKKNISRLKRKSLKLIDYRMVVRRSNFNHMVHGYPWTSLVPLDSIDRLSFRRTISLTRWRPR